MAQETFPPRGIASRTDEGTPPDRAWQAPETLGAAWDYRRGKIKLGHDGDERTLGLLDNRHMVTIAGSRSGKTRTLLIPNLLEYPGSVVVIDPKGELARATAKARQNMGQRVFILNPFPSGANDLPPSASHNPFSELEHSSPDTVAADVAQIADALIMEGGGERHWTDSAKNLLVGLILFAMAHEPEILTIRGIRSLLSNDLRLVEAWQEMAISPAFDGRLANIGNTFLGKLERDFDGKPTSPDGELRSILSTAREQTRPLDDVAHITEHSDFALDEIAHIPTTVYLVLPAMRISTHARWLRLFIYQLMAAIERNPLPPVLNHKADEWHLRLILEEFAALGHMQVVETAAGYMAGAGLLLWVVLQDLTQIKRHYPETWETFLGNAGIINAFGVVDATTTRYLSDLLGTTTIMEDRQGHVSTRTAQTGAIQPEKSPRTIPLLDPAEITLHFSRATNRQIVITPERPPVYMQRLQDGV
ncbi:type IV secretory system conjugative DNA transfer family protein [Pseudogemmobacter sonorensis]|uniref:type IV secretory system conjugative DNA transfer family protein n=1 Tax=Pseudogemmobacter sonorensis TaxID=2989681 RepID=UPI0036C18E21